VPGQPLDAYEGVKPGRVGQAPAQIAEAGRHHQLAGWICQAALGLAVGVEHQAVAAVDDEQRGGGDCGLAGRAGQVYAAAEGDDAGNQAAQLGCGLQRRAGARAGGHIAQALAPCLRPPRQPARGRQKTFDQPGHIKCRGRVARFGFIEQIDGQDTKAGSVQCPP